MLARATRSRAFLRGTLIAATIATSAACSDATSPVRAASALTPTSPQLSLTGASLVDVFADQMPGTRGDLRGLNNLGHVTGSFKTPAMDDFKAYRWTPAGLTLLSGVCCGTDFGTDINDADVVVGTAQTNFNEGVRAFRATGATMVNLGLLPGVSREGSSRALAINASGQVVGSSSAELAPFGITHAVLWSPYDVIRDLGSLGGSFSIATDINAKGQVIGSSTLEGDAVTHFFFWSEATGMLDISPHLNDPTNVVAINDAGQIAGTFPVSGATHAFLWSPGSGFRDLGTLGGASSAVTGLNDKGQVVGSSTLADGTLHDFLWSPASGMEDITATTGVTGARLLNDKLQTVTGGTDFSTGGAPRRLVQLNDGSAVSGPVARFTWSCPSLTCTFDASTSTRE